MSSPANIRHCLVTRLSQREYEVFLLRMRGRRSQAIAVALGIAHSTVKTHEHRIIAKLLPYDHAADDPWIWLARAYERCLQTAPLA